MMKTAFTITCAIWAFIGTAATLSVLTGIRTFSAMSAVCLSIAISIAAAYALEEWRGRK